MKKENPKDKTTMTTREVAVLIEEFRSQFRTFGENLSVVKDKLDALYEDVSKQKEDIFVIKADVNLLKSDNKSIKADIAVMKRDLAEIKELLKSHDSRVTHLEAVK